MSIASASDQYNYLETTSHLLSRIPLQCEVCYIYIYFFLIGNLQLYSHCNELHCNDHEEFSILFTHPDIVKNKMRVQIIEPIYVAYP